MSKKDNDYPLYNEVWCSESDESDVKEIFTSTPVKPKDYVQPGKVLLMKRDKTVKAPGFVDKVKNVLVEVIKLR